MVLFQYLISFSFCFEMIWLRWIAQCRSWSLKMCTNNLKLMASPGQEFWTFFIVNCWTDLCVSFKRRPFSCKVLVSQSNQHGCCRSVSSRPIIHRPKGSCRIHPQMTSLLKSACLSDARPEERSRTKMQKVQKNECSVLVFDSCI